MAETQSLCWRNDSQVRAQAAAFHHDHIPVVEFSSSLSPLSPLFLWLHCAVFQILVPYPGTEPGPSAVKTQNPNHWTTREFSQLS